MVGLQSAWMNQGLVRWGTLIVLGMLIPGCAVRFISDYDERIDRDVMDLQRKVESLLIEIEGRIGTPQAGYELYQLEYDSIKIDIQMIAVRVDAKPQNRRTAQQIRLLRENIERLEQVHQLGIRDRDVVAVLREQFRSAFVAILSLELAKKRGG